MATTEDSQRHEITVLSNTEENTTSARESTRLILGNERQVRYPTRECRCQRCYPTSKAIILLLLWNLILIIGLESFIDPSYYSSLIGVTDGPYVTATLSGITYSVIAFLYLFYPLAGCLADIWWGRYKTIVNSLCVIWGSLVVIVVFAGMATVCFIPLMIKPPDADFLSSTSQIIIFAIVCVVFGLPIAIAVLLLPCGLVSFRANVIQYGADLLHDASTEDSILYIHWYVWTSYAGLVPMKLGTSISTYFFSGSPFFISYCL